MNNVAQVCHGFVILVSSRCAGQERKAHFKPRSGTQGAFYVNLAAVSLDNPLHNGEAEPCAARFRIVLFIAPHRILLSPRASAVSAIEALKEIGQVLIRDSWTIILYPNHAKASLQGSQLNTDT